MPYINRERRVLMAAGAPPENAGELTFAFQQLIRSYLARQPLRYQYCAEVLGALDGARIDFVQQKLIPYEETRKAVYGDVWD